MSGRLPFLLLVALVAMSVASDAQQLQPDPVCVPASVQQSTPILRNLQGQVVPQPLLNARADGMLPQKLPPDVMLSLEGGTYFWLYRQIFNFLGWAPCPLTPMPTPTSSCLAQSSTGNPSIPYCAPNPAQLADIQGNPTTQVPKFCASCKGTSYPTPEGWELQAILNVTAQYAGQPAAVPVGAVLTPAAKTKGKQLVVVMRGAAFNGDGVYSTRFNQTSAGAYGAGAVHVGYKDMADQVWGALAAVLDAEIVDYRGPGEGVTDILISGHSVGGALGTLLSARTQGYLSAKCAQPGKCRKYPPRNSPNVSLVTFGSVNVGNAAFLDDFNTRVNARVVDFEKDRTQQSLISRWPLILAPGTNSLVLPNPLENYTRIGGAIPFSSSDMPYQPEVWGAITDPGASLPWPQNELAIRQWGAQPVTIDLGIQYPRGQVYTASTHVCSYMCKMSTYIQGAGPATWCPLAKDDNLSGVAATYCSQFPPYAFAKVFPLKDNPPLFP